MSVTETTRRYHLDAGPHTIPGMVLTLNDAEWRGYARGTCLVADVSLERDTDPNAGDWLGWVEVRSRPEGFAVLGVDVYAFADFDCYGIGAPMP